MAGMKKVLVEQNNRTTSMPTGLQCWNRGVFVL